MTLAAKHHFVFKNAPATSPVIAIFRSKWLADHGYAPDLPTFATHWTAVTRGTAEKEGVYALFGWRFIIPHAIEVTDFYVYPGRYGVLAGRAAMERVKADCDRMNVDLVTGIPPWNTEMAKDFETIFEVEGPDTLIYRYHPKADEKAKAV